MLIPNDIDENIRILIEKLLDRIEALELEVAKLKD